jgi:hypothetical protein
MTDSNPYRSAADRAREDRRQFPLRGDTWSASMRIAREARRNRTAAAAHAVTEMARDLAVRNSAQDYSVPCEMWSVRGEWRSREHFGDPHPGDFPGGFPPARECPI